MARDGSELWLDDIADSVHNARQLALFNAHYVNYCFQPIHIFEARKRQTGSFPAASWQAAFRLRGGAYPQAGHRPYQAQLAPGPHRRAW